MDDTEEQAAKAKEWNRRRNLSNVTMRTMHAGRCTDYILSNCGVNYGSKTEFRTRGKVTQTLYVLPHVSGLEVIQPTVKAAE
jgi:hypothetical protein